MKVAIVTTCFNRSDTVVKAVRSVMFQTYPNIEHIIIDGGSTDGSVEAIRACGSTRISHLISERDNGCYNALNKGLRLASADIVCWLHSDDVFYDDHVVENVVEAFKKNRCDMVYANGLFVSPDNPNRVIRNWIGGDYSDRKIENGWLPLHTTVFVRKEIFDRSGGYCEDYVIAGDTDWLIRVMYKTGISIVYLPQYVVRMNYGGLSTNWKRSFQRWREDLRVYSRNGISPVMALVKKVLRKVPQFFSSK